MDILKGDIKKFEYPDRTRRVDLCTEYAPKIYYNMHNLKTILAHCERTLKFIQQHNSSAGDSN